MPVYTYKCYSCMKTFMCATPYVTVRDGGSCPRCNTLITNSNMVGGARKARAPEDTIFGSHLCGWRERMRNANRLMLGSKSSSIPMIQFKANPALDGALTTVEDQAVHALSEHLQQGRVPGLLDALSNTVVDSKQKIVHSNDKSLLVFRFYTGHANGLNASTQGVPWRPTVMAKITTPKRERGTMTDLARNHQRGVKQSGALLSDVVSTTCSLRNLVTCSVGGYQCTPGGQVTPIIFGMSHINPVLNDNEWAPKLALILLPPKSYVIDWRDHSASFDAISTAKDVSFFEREVSYDTWGGNHYLGEERILFVWDNPFRGMSQKNSGTASASTLMIRFGGASGSGKQKF